MSADEIRRERRREREFKRQQRTDERNLDKAFNDDGQLSEGWMEEILDTEDLEDKLQRPTIRKIKAMLNKQWVLSNLSGAEAHDRWYWLEVKKIELIAQHPPEDAIVQGPLRAYVYEDEHENLQPLTIQERQTIDQIIKTLQNMVTRSREGFERKQINTSIARSETESSQHAENGGLFDGLFSR